MSEKIHPKHLARIAAIQFLYQSNLLSKDITDGVDNFISDYIEKEEFFHGINVKFFRKLIAYASNEIDYMVFLRDCLSEKRRFEDSPQIEQDILKLAIAEMIYGNADMPVVINEYVEISKRFLDVKSTHFINAVLDVVSKKIEKSI